MVNLGPDIAACVGEKLELLANTNAEKFKWNTSDTTTSIKIYASGLYKLDAQNGNGCQSSDEVLVNFYDKPIVELKPEYPVCGKNPLSLDAQNAGSTYLWTSTTGSFSSTDKVVSISKDGIYYLKVTNAFGCSSKDTIKANKTDFAVVAEFLATSSIKAGDTIHMVNLSYPGKFTSKWDFGDGIVSDEVDPSHVYFISGTVLATLTVSNGICSDTKTKSLNLRLRKEKAVKDTVKKSIFETQVLYPNPSEGRFLLEATLSEQNKMYVEFYSLAGKLIESRELAPSKNHHIVFEQPEIPNGMYFVRMTVKEESKFFKVIILK